jgi:carboxylesterase type B
MNKVKLDTGYITGTKVSQAGREINIYKGIPYAAPPIG